MSLNTYLFFDGDCREAFELYRSVFGGEFQELQTYGDAPTEAKMPESEKDRIMHVSLAVGSSVMMGSDIGSTQGGPPVKGTNFAISVVGESKEHCDGVFARLSEGGAVDMPLQETFWGAYFGSWTDRFGVGWMINYQLPQE